MTNKPTDADRLLAAVHAVDRLIKPERREQIRIALKCDRLRTRKHKKRLRELIGKVVEDGDTVNVTYTFNLDYFGKTASNMQFIRKLVADDGVVFKVDIKEIQHGESVLLSLLDEIRALQGKKKLR